MFNAYPYNHTRVRFYFKGMGISTFSHIQSFPMEHTLGIFTFCLFFSLVFNLLIFRSSYLNYTRTSNTKYTHYTNAQKINLLRGYTIELHSTRWFVNIYERGCQNNHIFDIHTYSWSIYTIHTVRTHKVCNQVKFAFLLPSFSPNHGGKESPKCEAKNRRFSNLASFHVRLLRKTKGKYAKRTTVLVNVDVLNTQIQIGNTNSEFGIRIQREMLHMTHTHFLEARRWLLRVEFRKKCDDTIFESLY